MEVLAAHDNLRGRSGVLIREDATDVDVLVVVEPGTDMVSEQLQPFVVAETMESLTLGWDPPASEVPSRIEFRVRVADVPVQTDGPTGTILGGQVFVLRGNTTEFHIDELNGQPLAPGDEFAAVVEYRRTVDRVLPDGGWMGRSLVVQMQTTSQHAPVELLGGRLPRVHLRQPLKFNANRDTLKSGHEALIHVVDILDGHPDVELSVECHTSDTGRARFGRILSKKRADAVAQELARLGVAHSRMSTVGHGSSKPRFNAGHPKEKQNRRVELRIKPGSKLYEKLSSADSSSRE